MRKIISLILCLVIVLTMLIPTVTFASPNQFVDSDSLIRFQVLEKLGVLDDEFENLSLDGNITRGEFAGMATRAFGVSFANQPVSYPFADVDKNTRFASDIVNLYEMNIVTGGANQLFYPENPITFNEALSIIVKLLGFTPMAIEQGGYPYGYQRTATTIDLIDTANDYEEVLTGEEAVTLIYSSMTIDRMESNYSNPEEYTVTENSNIFLQRYSLYYGSGVVDANEVTALSSAEGCSEGKVLIDGISYSDPENTAISLLGYNVDFLYRLEKNNTEKQLFSVCASSLNSVARINSEDILIKEDKMYDTSSEKENIRYAMDNNIYVIYNGKFYGVDFGYEWIPSYGYVTLIDNDDDGTYEVAIVKNFDNYIVRSVDDEEEIVYDIYYNAVELKKNSLDKCIYYKDGVLADAKAIAADDVISVCKSKDGTYTEVYISSATVEGAVEMFKETENKVLINDIWYSIAPNYLKAVEKGDEAPIDASTSGKFLIDIKGEIACVVSTDLNGLIYGYIVAVSDGNGVFGSPVLKIFNQLGEFAEVEIPDRVKVNGIKDKEELTAEELVLEIKDGNTRGTAKNQLIKYQASAAGELREISFAQKADGKETPDLLVQNYSKSSRTWRPSSRSFNGVMGVSANTLVMVVPENSKDINEEKAYKAAKLNFFVNDGTYSVEGYDCSDADVAKALVVYSNSESVTDDSAVNVFKEAIRTLDADGNECYKICYWQRGAYKETFVSDDSVFENAAFEGNSSAPKGLEFGDAFRVATDSNGKISLIYKILDMSLTNPAQGGNPSQANFNHQFRTIYGKVLGIDGTNILLGDPNGGWKESHAVHDPSKQTKFMYCDLTSENSLRAADVSMIARCVNSSDYMVLLRTRYCYAYDLIIYKLR